MRTCGRCSECCYAPEVSAFAKPMWKSCAHRCKGALGGCAIYKERPEECRTFSCLWLDNEQVPAKLRPDRSGLMVVGRPGNVVQVWEIRSKYDGSFWQRLLEAYDFEVQVMEKPRGDRSVCHHERR